MLKKYAVALFLLLLGVAMLSMAFAAVHWTFVVEKDPSTGYLVGMTTTLLLLAGFGLGTLHAAWYYVIDARPKPATAPRTTRGANTLFFTWLAAAFGLSLSAPLIFYSWEGMLDLNAAIALVIPLITLLWLMWSLRETMVYRRTGEWTLQFLDVPRIGKPLRGSLRFHKGPGEPVYRLILKCEQTLGKGEDTVSNNLHDETQDIRPEADALHFEFRLPDYAVGTHPANFPPRWSLEIMPESGDLSRTFNFTVEAPQGEEAERVQAADDARAARAIDLDAGTEIPADLAVIKAGTRNFRLSYSPRRYSAGEVVAYFLAAVMLAVAMIIFVVHLGRLASVIFIFLAGGFALAGYLSRWRLLNVLIDDGLIRLEERGRGRGREVVVACKEIERIAVRVDSQSTMRETARYRFGIDAVLQSGARLNIGDGIDDAAVAHALVGRLAVAVGDHVRKGDVHAAIAAHGVMVLKNSLEP